jgi:hypothetical protein
LSNDRLSAIPTTKLSGTITNAQLATGIDSNKIVVSEFPYTDFNTSIATGLYKVSYKGIKNAPFGNATTTSIVDGHLFNFLAPAWNSRRVQLFFADLIYNKTSNEIGVYTRNTTDDVGTTWNDWRKL